ncbi:MAG: STAS domain-containing protein, partial [Woeseiaceae bacterium]
VATLVRASRGDAIVLLLTFLLVIFRDLTTGIFVGFAAGALLFLHRMAQAVAVEQAAPRIEEDKADSVNGRRPYDSELATDPDIAVVRISGAFFFGTAGAVGAALDRIGEHPRACIIDFSAVSLLDSTGAATIDGFVRNVERRGGKVYIVGAARAVRRTLLVHGIRPPRVRYRQELREAVELARDGFAPQQPG